MYGNVYPTYGNVYPLNGNVYPINGIVYPTYDHVYPMYSNVCLITVPFVYLVYGNVKLKVKKQIHAQLRH